VPLPSAGRFATRCGDSGGSLRPAVKEYMQQNLTRVGIVLFVLLLVTLLVIGGFYVRKLRRAGALPRVQILPPTVERLCIRRGSAELLESAGRLDRRLESKPARATACRRIR